MKAIALLYVGKGAISKKIGKPIRKFSVAPVLNCEAAADGQFSARQSGHFLQVYLWLRDVELS